MKFIDHINILSLFDGISCGQAALARRGIRPMNYFASEIDKTAISITQRNFPKTKQIGDVLNITGEGLPKINIMFGGSPCQGFSIARGKDTKDDPRNKLALEFARIKDTVVPDNFLFENVVMSKAEQRVISDALGVEPILINSDLFVPQNRPRLYWTDMRIEELPQRPEWNYRFWQYRRNHWRENKSGVCPCLTANMGTGGNNVPYIMEQEQRRVLSCEELEGLQSLPFGYTSGVCTSQRRKMIGDSWTVDVIAHILIGAAL